eukprot:jgi/Tetstr1/462717/TSEL_007681.t1
MATPAPRAFSSRLKGMKFMQRAEEKKNKGVASKRKREEDEEARWVVRPEGGGVSQAKGCVVVLEADPPPGALLGRMSFQSFSDATERLQAEAEEGLAEVKAEAVKAEPVTDEDMARRLKKRRKQDER